MCYHRWGDTRATAAICLMTLVVEQMREMIEEEQIYIERSQLHMFQYHHTIPSHSSIDDARVHDSRSSKRENENYFLFHFGPKKGDDALFCWEMKVNIQHKEEEVVVVICASRDERDLFFYVPNVFSTSLQSWRYGFGSMRCSCGSPQLTRLEIRCRLLLSKRWERRERTHNETMIMFG